mmetsp:Transcript_30871/g.80506  ORF Transcript_30871/g.80506 Transcript_30871/m.80506 type:complete len:510 (-) Transcript_30871:230-1759(-)
MGGCCSKGQGNGAVSPSDMHPGFSGKGSEAEVLSNGKGRSTLGIDTSNVSVDRTTTRGSVTRGPTTPNVFAHLGINGLDEDGDLNKMKALGKGGSEQPEQIGSNESAVKVAVLIRPLLPFESEKGATNVLKVLGQGKLRMEPRATAPVIAPPGEGPVFDFDRVFNMTSQQASRDMFRTLAMQITEKFCQGFNASMLAYGQTGSGKTYTMGTAIENMGPDVNKAMGKADGIIPRLIVSLFGYTAAASEIYDIELKVQYIEIYNEQVNDLLVHAPGQNIEAVPSSTGSKLDIREHASGEVFVEGANSMIIRSPADLAYAMQMGNAVRATASHKLNEHSSRSHAIVTIHMEQKIKSTRMKEFPSELHYLRSKLQIVDLAGSERAKGTGNEGKRFEEGVNINKSLLELGNCINALTDGNRKHVPYRNSKLTRVLKDSLGGSAETLMLACVSPANVNYEQTLNTLRYAQRARAIKNNLKLNNAMSLQEEVEFLRAMVSKLEDENATLRAQVLAK